VSTFTVTSAPALPPVYTHNSEPGPPPRVSFTGWPASFVASATVRRVHGLTVCATVVVPGSTAPTDGMVGGVVAGVAPFDPELHAARANADRMANADIRPRAPFTGETVPEGGPRIGAPRTPLASAP